MWKQCECEWGRHVTGRLGGCANNNARSRAYNIRAVFFSTFLLAPPQYLTYEILTDNMFSYYTTLKNLVCVATVESSAGRRRTPRQTMIFEWKQLKSRECGGTFRRISWVMKHDKRLGGLIRCHFLDRLADKFSTSRSHF